MTTNPNPDPDIQAYIERERKLYDEKVRKYLKKQEPGYTPPKDRLKGQKLNAVIKLAAYSLLAYVASGLVVGVGHELGHVSVCILEGYNYRIALGENGFFMVCSSEVSRPWTMDLAGPVAGLGVALGLALVGKRFWLPLLIAGSAYMVDQAIKVGIEGFWNSLYQSGSLIIILTVIQLVAFAVCLIYFGWRRAHSYIQKDSILDD